MEAKEAAASLVLPAPPRLFALSAPPSLPVLLSCWLRPGLLTGQSRPGLSLRPCPGHPPGFLLGRSLPGLFLRPHPGCLPGFLFGRILPGLSLQLCPGSLPGPLDCVSLPGSTLPSLPGLAGLPCWHWLSCESHALMSICLDPHPSCYLFIGSFSPPVFPRYPPHLLPLKSPCVCSSGVGSSSYVLCPALPGCQSVFPPTGLFLFFIINKKPVSSCNWVLTLFPLPVPDNYILILIITVSRIWFVAFRKTATRGRLSIILTLTPHRLLHITPDYSSHHPLH